MNILNTQTLSNEALQSKLDQAMAKPELTAAGDLQHFIGVEGLSKAQLMAIIEKANGYLTDNAGRPNSIRNSDELEGCTVMNLF
ncbi:MAG: aspartate carbamoyltransferase catalytic subunit, partial [Pseudomonadota bacterium]